MAEIVASVQIHGLRELDATLRRLPDEVAGPIITTALTEAGETIRNAAAGNIHSRTGRTAADIRVELQVHPEQASGVAAIGGTLGQAGRARILRWLELGTRAHVEPKRRRR